MERETVMDIKIRNDAIVCVDNLPADLTKKEAEKLCNIIRTCVAEQPSTKNTEK